MPPLRSDNQQSCEPYGVRVPRRYLVAENGNVAKATERYEATLAWRKEMKVDSVLAMPQIHYDTIKKHYTQFLHKHDKLGHPIYIEKLSSLNMPQLKKAGIGQDTLLRHYLFTMEFTLKYAAHQICPCDACASSDTQKMCVILDARGIGMRDMGGESFEFIRRCLGIMQRHYPQRSFKIFIVNVPSWFGMAWKGVKPLLNEATRAKTNILTERETAKALLKFIDADSLPVEYGGNCKCAGSCGTHSSYQLLQRALVKSVLQCKPFESKELIQTISRERSGGNRSSSEEELCSDMTAPSLPHPVKREMSATALDQFFRVGLMRSPGRSDSIPRRTRSFWQKFPEKEELNQYWYSTDTFDPKFSSEGDRFIPFDFHKPQDLPQDLLGTFDFIVIDPPFITREVWELYTESIKLLMRSKDSRILLTTIEENAVMINELLGCRARTFKPSIPHLVYHPAASRRHTGGLTNRLKHLVSKEKRRFSADGFDLDLTYVTQRLVALGYPAEKIEGIYRNHYRDVFRFFEQRHSGQYRVYNLCVERRYAPDEKFHGRVAEFGFEDHTPPPLAMFLPFCRDVHDWFESHPGNIVAVHCKAGKGRTGVMLSAYMIYSRLWRSAHGALEYFAAARSMKLEGVTILSQRRFVGYFGEMCRRAESAHHIETLGSYEDAEAHERAMTLAEYHSQWEQETQLASPRSSLCAMPRPHAEPVLPDRVNLALVAVVLCGVTANKKTNTGAAEWRVRVECGAIQPRAAVYDLPGNFQRQRCASIVDGSEDLELELQCNRVVVWDEVKVQLRRRSGGALGHFWFHTAFVSRVGEYFALNLAKSEIDKVAKDVKNGHKKFAPEFAVRLRFELATAQDMAKFEDATA
ncbi:hypothetical protein BBO99_00005535 [Phytophthora kernoviae]|uniref:Phosphatidylinositol-3,4,5-trisphosphate 3-phosphatase n=1 Tax=Phytophthora kernoviae TaxID=325452 RepID=A0A3R7FZ66_9STRA|nr:hypothetical protein BBI17_005161 [Phytophthora kernoviae]RLN79076.1 hypothetical protein BBO99_00005535 [Phytophthora kernoviae]